VLTAVLRRHARRKAHLLKKEWSVLLALLLAVMLECCVIIDLLTVECSQLSNFWQAQTAARSAVYSAC
jgi:hypothetical protein